MTSEEKKNTLISCVEMALIYCACLYGLYLYFGELDSGVFVMAFIFMIEVFYIHIVVRNITGGKKDRTIWRGLKIWARARRIKEAHTRAVYREYNEFWMEENRDFIKKCDKEIEKEIERDCERSSEILGTPAYFNGSGFGISPPGSGGS